MIPQFAPQRLMQEVGGRVIQARLIAHTGINAGINGVPYADTARGYGHMVQVMALRFCGVVHIQHAICGDQPTTVAHLSATFAIEGRSVQDHHSGLA